MSNKTVKKSSAKAAQKKVNVLPLIAAVAVVICVSVVFLVNRNGTTTETVENNETGNVTVIASGDSLAIPIADITEDVSFFPLEVDGTAMEVIAVRDSEGNIRTAFNTCQSCYTSGRGYYEQEGNDLVCQNCGFHFTAEQVEVTSGGCNPWPIYAENKTETDDEILISYDFLVEAQNIFKNWKI